MKTSWPSLAAPAIALALAATPSAFAQTALSGPQLRIARATGRINIDGNLDDEAWRTAERIEQWYEINPGDNVEPAVRSAARLTYDDRFFYAGFEFDDPNPRQIRAPYSDRDGISGNFTDYAGVIIDARNDGHSAVLFLATPRGIQYDAVTDDASGENSSPDFFWDSAGRITDRGWTLEIRIPFSSLRYERMDPQTWGILLYRNYPRDFRYQIVSTRLPRGGSCFICRANTLAGLQDLPPGGHLVAAPYASVSSAARPVGNLGSPLTAGDTKGRGGVDVKWSPAAESTIDLTVKPDFSQIESDVAQISANERFALFFPEKRTFFLEGVELLETPIRAVYTRTITAPRWGSRLTGKSGASYTVLVADDAGGGSVVLPGPNDSSLAPQDFGSYVVVARAKRDIRRSFVSMLVTDREAHDGEGHNRVAGPDFQWRPNDSDTVTGQWLFSDTSTPRRPDLAREWTGQSFSSHGAHIDWNHNTSHSDVNVSYKDFGDGFRADVGFVPQVGYRDIAQSAGWMFRPNGAFRNVRVGVSSNRQIDRAGALISRNVTPRLRMDVKGNGHVELRFVDDRTRSGIDAFRRRQLNYQVRFNPSRRIAEVEASGTTGEEIDFANSRPAHGSTLTLSADIQATDHLALSLLRNQRSLDVDARSARRERLFTAGVSRVRATYTFTARSFARIIGQYISTARDPRFFLSPVPSRSGAFSGSALLAYKLNWQSVLFVGYGDDRELSDVHELERAGRQFFVKMSYAFQM